MPKDGFPLRFGAYEFDPATGELSKEGARVELGDEPAAVLAAFLERPGELIRREDLQKKLSSGAGRQGVEPNLDAAMGCLRVALNDSGDQARYIETVPGRGYRFIARVEGAPAKTPSGGLWARWSWLVILGAFVLLGVGLWSWGIQRRISASLAASQSTHAIAVLPFENRTGDPAQDDFAEGLTDAIIVGLAQGGSLRVIPRASVMRYKQTHEPLPEIARELGVEGIVEGSVALSGLQVRVSSRLILASSGRQIWARSYERALTEIAGFKGQVAQAIAGDIRAVIAPEKPSP